MSSISSKSIGAIINGRRSILQIPQSQSASFCLPWKSFEMKLQAGLDDKGSRLDQFLARHLENITRSQIQLLNRTGAVHIEGRQEKSGYRIRGGETVDVDVQSFVHVPLAGEPIPLQIHY